MLLYSSIHSRSTVPSVPAGSARNSLIFTVPVEGSQAGGWPLVAPGVGELATVKSAARSPVSWPSGTRAMLDPAAPLVAVFTTATPFSSSQPSLLSAPYTTTSTTAALPSTRRMASPVEVALGRLIVACTSVLATMASPTSR